MIDSLFMAQRRKEHVRAAIVAAAASLFAEAGYDTTTIAAIAERAGSSIGNVYKYFDGKEELFSEVLPLEFAREVKRMTRARIEALGSVRDIQSLAPDARYHVLAGKLLDYCLAHRERIIILLGRAEGTAFASFADDFASKLVDWALAYARRAYPSVAPSPRIRFALRSIYTNYLASIANAFAAFRRDEQIREAVEHLTAHHQGGLKRLFETAAAAAGGSIRGGSDGRRNRSS